MSDLTRGLFFVDSHWGYERVGGRKRPIHDPKAHDVLIQIAQDFKPHILINGGDGLDCGAISHWSRGKPRLTEGLRLEQDAGEYHANVLMPLARISSVTDKRYHRGNHELWIEQLVDENPGLEGTLSLDSLLTLNSDGWKELPQGAVSKVGKLHFMHGNTITGSTPARRAVELYGRSIVLGHFHSPQHWTQHSALDATDVHVGRVVGCLCRRDPGYGKRTPNRWAQSFLLFEVTPSGGFQVYEVNIFNGRAIYSGKVYTG